MNKFLEEFKAFAMRGNVVDMAVGVVVGGAFGKITSSLVNDVIMPAVSMLTGGINFSDWKLILKQASVAADGTEIAAVSINYGTLLSTILDFIILAFAVFCMVKLLNNLHRKKEEEPAPVQEPAPPEPSAEEKLLAEIRDLLKEKQ